MRKPWTPALLATAAIAMVGAASAMAFHGGVAATFELAATAAIAVATVFLSRARNPRTNWSTIADTFLITAAFGMVMWTTVMVPFFGRSNDDVTAEVFATMLSVVVILQFASTVLLMLGGGRSNASWRLLVGACASAFSGLFMVLVSRTGNSNGVAYHLDLALFAACTGFAIVAAKQSDKAALTDVTPTSHRTSPPRLMALALAVLTPPVTIVFNTTQSDDLSNIVWLGPCWALTTALLMFRFGEMIYARERSARLERLLAVGAAKLGHCSTREEICDLTAEILRNLAEREVGIRAAVITPDNGGDWLVTSNPSGKRSTFLGSAQLELLMDADVPMRGFLPREINDDDETGPQLRPLVSMQAVPVVKPIRSTVKSNTNHHLGEAPQRRRNGSVNADSWIGVRYVTKEKPMGVLVLVSDKQLAHAVEDAMVALAGNVSLALEAASLSENLHRQRSDRRFRALVEHSRDVIIVINAQGKTSFRSPAAEELLVRNDSQSDQVLELIAKPDRQTFYDLISVVWARKLPLGVAECRVGGSPKNVSWFEFTVTDMRDNDEIGGLVINGRDITERKTLEADLRFRALHDDLTGIPNRAFLRDRAGHALGRIGRSDEQVAIMFIDLDDFKVVNDGLGHEAGDELLRVIAFRLTQFVRNSDTPARLGGDEFAVLFEGFGDTTELMAMARRMLDVIVQPVEFAGRELTVGASVGIAVGNGGEDVDALLRNADVAMYHAKWGGKNRVQMFEPHMSAAAVDRLEIKADLAHMLDRDELKAYYQPIVFLKDRKVAGFESLARWIHPDRGLVPPDHFIPLTEASGLIVPLGNAILRQSLQQLSVWHQAGLDNLTLSVNMSPRQLLEESFVFSVEQLLAHSGINPRSLTMELTEGEVLTDNSARRRLADLGKLGVGIAADDFGSGFASYASLVDLPFTMVKIDRTILMQAERDPGRTQSQLRSMVEMASDLGLRVVGEGVETPMQEQLLRDAGCDLAQGYFFGRPAPASEWSSVDQQSPAS